MAAHAWLRYATRGRDERRVELSETPVRVGRAADNELSIPDLSLSRLHAQVVGRTGGHFIEDLQSRNGTFLNDELVVAPRLLRHDDVIRVGETTFIYQVEGESDVRLSDKHAVLGEGTVAFPVAELLNQAALGSQPEDRRLVESLARASHILIGRGDLTDVSQKVLDVAMDAVRAERGALMLLEGTPLQLVAKATRLLPGQASLVLSRSIARTVLDEKSGLITTDAQEDPRFDGSQSISLQGIRAAICAPLWHEEGVIGLIYLDRRFSARQFSETDLTLLTVLSNLTAAKLENLRLLREAELKRKLEQELELAAVIQRNLLPGRAPQLAGWEFASSSVPSRSVGGDFYDYIEKRVGQIGVVVADVSGKGVSAALLMASLQANVRAFAVSTEDLAAMMSQVNDALARLTSSNKFATVFYADIALSTGSVRYVNGGHNPALIVRAMSGEIESLAVGGMIVGAFAGIADYQVGLATLGPGDLLVLFSDGVTEATGPDDTMFGDERLREVVVASRDQTATVVRDRLLDSIEAFAAGCPPSDDTTIMVVRRLPEPG